MPISDKLGLALEAHEQAAENAAKAKVAALAQLAAEYKDHRNYDEILDLFEELCEHKVDSDEFLDLLDGLTA